MAHHPPLTTMLRGRIALVGLLLVAVALPVGCASVADQSESAKQVTGLPQDEASLAELRRQMHESADRQAATGGPKLLLPEDQRAGWIMAWNRMRDCAIAKGFHGVPPVAPTFGDGATPAPIIQHTGGMDEAGLAECRFDERLFDREKVAAAVRSQSGG